MPVVAPGPIAPPRPAVQPSPVTTGPLWTPNPWNPNLGTGSQLGLQASQLVGVSPGVSPSWQSIPLQVLEQIGQSVVCPVLPFPPLAQKAKTRVMRADIAWLWVAWSVNQLSAHTMYSVRQQALSVQPDWNAIGRSMEGGLNTIIAAFNNHWRRQLMEQKDSPKRKERTGLSRQSHKHPYAYPAGGPLALPIRPKQVASQS